MKVFLAETVREYRTAFSCWLQYHRNGFHSKAKWMHQKEFPNPESQCLFALGFFYESRVIMFTNWATVGFKI